MPIHESRESPRLLVPPDSSVSARGGSIVLVVCARLQEAVQGWQTAPRMAAARDLVIADEPADWSRLGFAIGGDGRIALGALALRLAGRAAGSGFVALTVEGLAGARTGALTRLAAVVGAAAAADDGAVPPRGSAGRRAGARRGAAASERRARRRPRRRAHRRP